jgi:solute carrier family 35 (UDP-galactose transporter), member B1
MFTMILSVVVYNHALTAGQWMGAGTVFAGIGVEAWAKRRGQCIPLHLKMFTDVVTSTITDVHSKRVIQEREKARIKQL